jgi:hypothetical protein
VQRRSDRSASTLTATPGSLQPRAPWSSVSGASRCWVFDRRTRGLQFLEDADRGGGRARPSPTQVANGRPYFYNVMPVSASSACRPGASTCVRATPDLPRARISRLACTPSSLEHSTGGAARAPHRYFRTASRAAVSLSAPVFRAERPAAQPEPGDAARQAGGTARQRYRWPVNDPDRNVSFQVQGVSGVLLPARRP